MACCTGEEIDVTELGRTEGQKEMGEELLKIIMANIKVGATPFGGELSQPPDPGMLAAMNTMMNIGGYGDYAAPPPPPMPTGPVGPQPISGTTVTGEASSAGLRPDARVAGPSGSLVNVYPGVGVSGPSSKANVPEPGPTGVSNVGPTGPSPRPDKPRPGPAYPTINPWPQTGAGPPLASTEPEPLSHAANVRSVEPGYGPIGPIGPPAPPSSAGLRPDARSAGVGSPPVGPPVIVLPFLGPQVEIYPGRPNVGAYVIPR